MSAWGPLEANTSQVCQLYRRDYGGNLWGTYAIDLVCALDIVDATGKGVHPILEEWSPGDDEGCRAMIDEAAVAYCACAALAAILRLPEQVWHDNDRVPRVRNRAYVHAAGMVGPAVEVGADGFAWGWELWCTHTANMIDHGGAATCAAAQDECDGAAKGYDDDEDDR